MRGALHSREAGKKAESFNSAVKVNESNRGALRKLK